MSIRRLIASTLTVALVALGLIAVPPTPVSAAGETAQLPTANPANFTPNVLDGEVDSIWQVGNTVIIGGTFTQVANADAERRHRSTTAPYLAAFNATTGVVNTTFAPVLDGVRHDRHPGGRRQARSTSVATSTRSTARTAARSRASTWPNGSLVTGFNANGVNGVVRTCAWSAANCTSAALFTTVAGNQPRQSLASLNATTGALTTKLNLAHRRHVERRNRRTSSSSRSLPAGDRMLMIGNFTHRRRPDARPDRDARPDHRPGDAQPVVHRLLRSRPARRRSTRTCVTSTSPRTAPSRSSRPPARSGQPLVRHRRALRDRQHLTAPTTRRGSTGRAATPATRSRSTTASPTSAATCAGPTTRPPATAPVRAPCPVQGMMALDVETGLPFSWNPGRERGVGLFDYHVTDAGLWAGSDTDRWNQRVAPAAGVLPVGRRFARARQRDRLAPRQRRPARSHGRHDGHRSVGPVSRQRRRPDAGLGRRRPRLGRRLRHRPRRSATPAATRRSTR